MKKIVFLFSTFIFSQANSLSAESYWLEVVVSPTSGGRYVQPESIFEVGPLLHVLTLDNYEVRQDTGELSAISNDIMSCERNMIKSTRLRAYARRNGEGRMIADHDLLEYELDVWREAQRGSFDYIYIRAICSAIGR